MRIVDAHLGLEAQVRLVVSRVSKPDRLRSAWSSSGATVERVGDRLHATTTVQALARAAGRSLDRDEASALDNALHAAAAAWIGPTHAVSTRAVELPFDQRPLIMGILNVTPDSFADGGVAYPQDHPGPAISRGRTLAQEGADLVDVGGESTRPGADPVTADEELGRVVPVVTALAGAGIVVSIDTRKSDVADAALQAGAKVVNDTSGAADDGLLDVAAKAQCAYVLMHSRGTPADMATLTDYTDVVAEVYEFLLEGIDRCVSAGIARSRIIVDPGIGFAKTAEQNLALLRDLRQFRGLGCPVMVGASRKSFIGKLTGTDVGDRLPGSLAVAALATGPSGAACLRVHDVAETVQAVGLAHAIHGH